MSHRKQTSLPVHPAGPSGPSGPSPMPLRSGPNPLGLHLAMMSAAAIRAHVENPASGARDATERLARALRGIELWRAHPFRRPDGRLVRRHPLGQSSLLDIAQARQNNDKSNNRGGDGIESENGRPLAHRKPILLVPSLINPPSILDLLPDNSFAGFLYDQGFAPMLLDWGSHGSIR